MFFRCLIINLRVVLSDGSRACGGNGQRCVRVAKFEGMEYWQENELVLFEYIRVNSRIILT